MNPAFCGVPSQFSFRQSRQPETSLSAIKGNIFMSQTSLSSVASALSRRGYCLKNESVGPLLKLSLYEMREDQAFVGDISGAVFPNNRLHIEAYQAKPLKREGSLFEVSPGMMLFIAALALGSEKGAQYVYGLAIDDSPEQHRRLVRYLKRFGGIEVKRISDSLADVPARMFYGGFGTIIRGDVLQILTRGQRLLERTTPAKTTNKE